MVNLFIYDDAKTTFQTIAWILNIALLCNDGVFGLLMTASAVLRTLTKTEEYARNWEKGAAYYSYFNFPCFVLGIFSVISYLAAYKDDIHLCVWFMFNGVQLTIRVYVLLITYAAVSALPVYKNKENQEPV